MKRTKVSSFWASVLIFTLVISLFTPFREVSASGNTIEDASILENGKEQTGMLKEPEQSQWYQISPGKDEIFNDSHMALSVKSESFLNVSVYASKEKAQKDETFDMYRSYTAQEGKSEINIPHAWKGPYYIKVEYVGEEAEDGDAVAAENGESDKTTEAAYTISYKGTKLQPADLEEESCPVEMSVDQKKSGKDILKQLRAIRDDQLNQTALGKQMSGLYYKAAPFIVAKLALNKETRNAVYQDLVTLQPMFKDVSENGADSSYTITENDQKAITRLYETAIKSVPSFLKKDMKKQAEQLKINQVKGKTAGAFLTENKLAPESNVQTGKVIFKVKDKKSLQSVNNEMKGFTASAQSKKDIENVKNAKKLFDNLYSFELPKDQKQNGSYTASAKRVKSAASSLSKMSNVEFAEPVQEYKSLSKDIQYSYQWPLKNNGEDGGVKGADVKSESANALLAKRKLNDTLIAVVDTGVDSTLSDLEGKVRTDLGRNFVGRNNHAMDDQGHGTHVAGIIAAESGNGYSMAGLHAKANIIPVKVLDSTGAGDTEQIALGIKYAADKGAKVINLSLGGGYSRVLEFALKYAASKNVTIAAASGNDGESELSYPASSKYVMSVGASNRMDMTADFSNYGKGLDITAPGSDIPSLVPNGNVTYMSGTSMATPYAAAAAGLLLSQNPKLKPNEVEDILKRTADDISFDSVDGGEEVLYDENGDPIEIPHIPGVDWHSGHGRLNVMKAVSAVDLQVKINKLEDTQTAVRGIAKAGTAVEVKNGKKKLGSAKAGKDGKFKVNIPTQKKDQVLHINASLGDAKTSVKTVVVKGKPSGAPKVNGVKAKDTAVKGKANSKATIKVKNKSKKVIASAKADNKGAFSVKIKKQKAGTVLYVTAADTDKKESKAVKVVVEK
ncbi:S8 family serine peptidase [Bacillus atrophaeus]|uniref:S8 family peptidase n=1 Tax=Bacillus atrophaeus TaxID=1452 RepID=UPI00227EA3E9|nr:S8 family peptidase [Bacillus atrophaeus]MCY8498853.1 peptidase S8 [Bacillus atrophaeus]MCY8814161.1 peptidase S8 [Bacillus atrophaeus]MCY8821990.1 peptidase S8 [Bacillus atrophaeus]MCY8830710.1 peptidase S8 [Bacillus atrophaeus]MCY8834757.1 peptidase S8 [Bacillus atrophaeus]